ncbi:MAG: hypothetical protein U9Q85_03290 [Patescibacteria group bacterium]|nr:hypothetical protein [Patescibacteria group bacterium]
MQKNRIIKRSFFCLLIIISFVFTPIIGFGIAAEEEVKDLNEYYNINLDTATIDKGYTVNGFDELKLSLTPGILNAATPVEIIKLNENLPEPWKLNRLSNFYQFEFKNKSAYQNKIPFYIQFHYSENDGNYKQVFFYDKGRKAWRPLPTKDFSYENFVRSVIHLPYARLAVFSYPGKMISGSASWYGYKPGNFAASPDFAKGSILRVWHKSTGNFVDVEINDYGPDRSLFPKRVIDLEKNAFASLIALGAGTTDVYLEPLQIESSFEVDADAGMGTEPIISAISALVMQEDGEVLWQKNSTSTRSLASLTKLVAIKTFFDTKPSLNVDIVYSEQDELYNYEHVNKWESARLRVSEGDILSIEDLVYASLTGSTNNTVETLVRAGSLSRPDFIARMNELVQEWGAKSTYFIEPSGLAPENVSSAQDYGIIMKECLKHPLIAKASIAYEHVITTRNTDKTFKVRNTNNLIRQYKYNIAGSKTGYLHEAGYCLAVKIENPSTGPGQVNNNFYVITMGAQERGISFEETGNLIEYAKRKLIK